MTYENDNELCEACGGKNLSSCHNAIIIHRNICSECGEICKSLCDECEEMEII